MKDSIIAATALCAALAAAGPQWGGPHGNGNGNGDPNGNGNGDGNGDWGNGGPFGSFPSCVSNCRSGNADYRTANDLCQNSDALNSINTCIDASSCTDQDKSDVKRTIAQLCANAGESITAAPYATYGVTSGGSAWPSAWTTNSAWASAVSNWASNGGPGGWHGGAGGYGPFGPVGPGGRGWGNGPWASNGSWTTGPWTKWWGTDACPPSTWPGWTDSTWATNAPWTTWSACTASTTASAVLTYTTTGPNGDQVESLTTSYGIRLAEATNAAVTTDSNGNAITSYNSGAQPTNLALAGSAAGILGVLAGAVLL